MLRSRPRAIRKLGELRAEYSVYQNETTDDLVVTRSYSFGEGDTHSQTYEIPQLDFCHLERSTRPNILNQHSDLDLQRLAHVRTASTW